MITYCSFGYLTYAIALYRIRPPFAEDHGCACAISFLQHVRKKLTPVYTSNVCCKKLTPGGQGGHAFLKNVCALKLNNVHSVKGSQRSVHGRSISECFIIVCVCVCVRVCVKNLVYIAVLATEHMSFSQVLQCESQASLCKSSALYLIS